MSNIVVTLEDAGYVGYVNGVCTLVTGLVALRECFCSTLYCRDTQISMATVDLKMWIQALLVLFFIPLSTTNLLQDDVGDVQDILFDELLRLDPLFGVEGAQSDGLQKVNRNPLVGLNLFKRDGCSLTLDGNVYTCTESANICCTDPNNSQSGWCCPNTAGCGPNDGTLGTCTIRL